MKIAIITISDRWNIGNRLQNFAVQELLKYKGAEVQTLGYFVEDTKGTKKERILSNVLARICVNDFTFKNIFLRLIKKSNRYKLVYKFNGQYININKKYTFKVNKMKKYVNHFDFYCAGSDQIWNPALVQNYNYFFMNFAPSEKAFSFSASMGTTYIADEYRQNYLSGFNHVGNISVRETDVKELIAEMTGRDVEVLLDPTLLLDKEKWDSISTEPNFELPDRFVVTYFLGNQTDSQKKYIKNYAEKNRCQVIDMNGTFAEDIGPSEFVYLIKNSQYVFTDSFHGTAFSVIYNKPFVSFQRNGMYDMSSRIVTLLEKFNLMERFCRVKDNKLDTSFIEYLDNLKEYDTKDVLVSEQQKADRFLDRCLSRESK